MIRVSDVYKSFGGEEVLKGINLTVKSGEIVVVIGPSGGGKSTLLRCLNYLEEPDRGDIQVGDLCLTAGPHKEKTLVALRRRAAFVFQNYALFRNKTALENIIEGLLTVQKVPRAEALARGRAILDQIGLAHKADTYPVTLSGGQQQRIGIGRAMAQGADVILFDEPTSSLDPEKVYEVLSLMRKLAHQHITMIVVTHEMQFARDVASRVVFMADGVIVEENAPARLFDFPKDPRTREFLSKVSAAGSISGDEG